MKERDKLKEICNLIGHESNLLDDYLDMGFHSDRYIDVREIIFTQEFWEKLNHYYYNKNLGEGVIWEYMEDNLHNPVDYIYNEILELGQKQ